MDALGYRRWRQPFGKARLLCLKSTQHDQRDDDVRLCCRWQRDDQCDLVLEPVLHDHGNLPRRFTRDQPPHWVVLDLQCRRQGRQYLWLLCVHCARHRDRHLYHGDVLEVGSSWQDLCGRLPRSESRCSSRLHACRGQGDQHLADRLLDQYGPHGLLLLHWMLLLDGRWWRCCCSLMKGSSNRR